MTILYRVLTGGVAAALAVTMAVAGPVPPQELRLSGARDVIDHATQWEWPLRGFRLTQPYIAPAHDYATGHRGIDLEPLSAPDVRAPAAGTVAFVGTVVDRGILTIDHGDGYVTTFEPVNTELEPGDAVTEGAVVARISVGGHTISGSLHFGVRHDGEYINPLLLLGGVPRAILLPCC
ncbi:murein hydrolase activator EnvC family protein [Microbacterium koreense]|uniref:Murein hydrolase activator EnvC family protein n=1 Tax=Microbacterium koreense TaxID=323761 RepID=A0ABW2ZS63_9MICO